MKILKFGGAVLRRASDFTHIAEILRHEAAGGQALVIVSALAATTRLLEQAAQQSQSGNDSEAAATLDSVIATHSALVDELMPGNEQVTLLIEDTRQRVAGLLRGVRITGELTPRTLDHIISYGEYLALHIMHRFLADHECDAGIVESTDVIITDAHHGAATPQRNATAQRVDGILRPAFASCPIVLMQGFVARSEHGDITTMGKESSNLTASLMGELLRANDVVIYTDVEGVQTADPKLGITGTQPIRQMSYAQAYHAAVNGVKLLYPTMIEPLRRAGIRLVIRSLQKPDGGATVVSALPDLDARALVTMMTDISTVRLVFPSVETRNSADTIVARLFPDATHILLRRDAPDSMWIAATHPPKTNGIHLMQTEGVAISAHAGIVLVTVIGSAQPVWSMMRGNLAEFLGDTAVQVIDSGADDGIIRILVHPHHAEATVRSLHAQILRSA
ncbi:MAG: hypothetical protein JNL32_08625 [Candidatus Kapabacteria bacterium]|nr:hypothetical protein [Candidatus Kapabacteria bacterium]